MLTPVINPDAAAAMRIGCGLLTLLTLLSTLPHARRFFLGERWGGYGERGWRVEAVQNPIVLPFVLAVWIAADLALVAGWHTVLAAAVNLAFAYYFFITMRWRTVLRGMGAPGFIAFWLGGGVFALELTARHAPAIRGLVLLTLQIDFALIMLSAGVYKMVSGYRAGDGMELGMVNPEWGYWASWWSRWPTSHPLFRVFNEMAWGTEVGAGVLMLIPATRALGGLAIALSFVFIASQIRLGFLCEMVIVCCLIFVPGGAPIAANGWLLPSAVQQAIAAALVTYLVLLPIVRAGMFYNQLAHRALPAAAQRALDLYTNTFGLIIWRVFTADVVNFLVRVWAEPDAGGSRRLLSDFTGFAWTHRFRQVAECIALTSVFTTLKYYPSRRAMFVDRLTRYARTISHPPESHLIFEWVNVSKRDDRFGLEPIAEYRVDTAARTVTDTVLNTRVSVTAPGAWSPVHEGIRPGSYVPLKR